MIIFVYLLKTILITALLFGYFWFFLRNRPFHRFNRFYLISIVLFSFLLPLFHFNPPGFWNHSSGESPIHLLGVGQGRLEEAVTVYAGKNSGNILSWQLIALLITAAISSFLFFRFIQTIRYLLNLRKNKITMTLPEATIYFVSEKGTPFSFFRSIFWGEETEIKSHTGNQILRHELFHVKNNHSLEIIGMEMMSILFWFNPFLHLIKRELKLIHEYEADAYAASTSSEFEYASLLLIKISGSPLPLTNPFFKNQIKSRIDMITKSNKNKKVIISRLMALPVITLLICLFSFKINGRLQLDTHLPFSSANTIRVVIDPGHGGAFTGTVLNGVNEKNINLSIAKKIQVLSAEYNVDVIMSRETDVTPGSKELQQSLEYIAALPKNTNADLFISIHTNATDSNQEGKIQTSKSGFQIYIPRSSSNVYEGSLKFGSTITEYIKPDYAIESELKQTRSGNILILKKATVPALLIECGYMDNPYDLKYLLDEKNQEKIARDILEGIRKYSQSSNAMLSNNGSGFSYAEKDQTTHSEITERSETTTIQAIANDHNTLELNENVSDSSGPFSKVEVEAYYPGDFEGWKNYLFRSLKYPDAALKKELQGEVIVAFIVNADGTLAGVHAISGPKELRAESVRVIKESGKWIPAMNNKVKVASYRKQPIIFKLA